MICISLKKACVISLILSLICSIIYSFICARILIDIIDGINIFLIAKLLVPILFIVIGSCNLALIALCSDGKKK